MDNQKLKKTNAERSSKHKHKKKKHHKQKKKSKLSSSESGSEGMEWIEAPATLSKDDSLTSEFSKEKNKRDDWMDEEMFIPTLSKEEMKQGSFSSRQKKLDAAMQEKEKNDAIQRERELNPHWKNNGSGLPEENAPRESLALPSTSVGDGGYSYLKKAYYRIQEQAQQEGRSMEEIAIERWGSLDKLKSLIDEAESRMNDNARNRYKSNKDNLNDRREQKHLNFHKPREKRSSSNSPERSYRYQKPKHGSRKDGKLGHFKSSDQKRQRKYDNDFKYDSDEDIKRHDYDSDRKRRDYDSDRKRHEYDSDRKRYAYDSGRRRNDGGNDRKKYTEDNSRDGVTQEDDKNVFVWDRTHSSSQHRRENKHDSLNPDYSDEQSSKSKDSKKDVPAWKKVKKPSEITDSKQMDKSASNWKKSMRSSSESAEEIEDKHPIENTPEKNEALSVMSEDDLNKLAARCTKAELFGNKSLASKLKKQLEEAREVLKAGGSINNSQRGTKKVLLTKMDSSGVERPIHYSNDVSQSNTMKKQAQKFFDDGSRYSLKQMFEREKFTTVDDNLEMFMEVAAKCQDVEDDNETSGISKKATNKMSHHLQEEKDVGRAIQQHQKRSAAMEKCCYCLDQPNMKGHLLIQKFEEVYLSIPNFVSLVEGHCLIVPNRHVPSFLALDENEWREVEDIKKKLRKLFRKEDKEIIVLETSTNFRHFPHAFLEIIPVPEEMSQEAIFYFKKAILESETEWANNVKLLDLNVKDLRHSVPKNLPYFCVEFDPKIHSGFAHVIEDEKRFERNFGKEVIGGMLDIDYNHLYKNRKEDPAKQAKETLRMIKMWDNLFETES